MCHASVSTRHAAPPPATLGGRRPVPVTPLTAAPAAHTPALSPGRPPVARELRLVHTLERVGRRVVPRRQLQRVLGHHPPERVEVVERKKLAQEVLQRTVARAEIAAGKALVAGLEERLVGAPQRRQELRDAAVDHLAEVEEACVVRVGELSAWVTREGVAHAVDEGLDGDAPLLALEELGHRVQPDVLHRRAHAGPKRVASLTLSVQT